MLKLEESLSREQVLLHELQFRDRVKSAEYHYAVSFEFDGFFDDALVDMLFEKIKQLSKEVEFDSFKLGCSWPEVDDAQKNHLKFSVQTKLINMIEKDLGKKAEFSLHNLEFLIDFNKKLVLIRIQPVFVRGRYCKYSRGIAQTEFFCNRCRGNGCWYCKGTGHFSSESVEQLIAKTMVPVFDSKLMILHGAGREDMDVLMLGKGRPFIAELLMPKKRVADLKKITEEINSSCAEKISVNSLEFCSLKDVSLLKDALHDKVYSAFVTSDKEVDFSKILLNENIPVRQRTPTRVIKRRADMERAKKVTVLRIGEITKTEFVVVMRTSHGTYVKEFISGDGEKTVPSISSLLDAHCSCKLLDVTEICE